MKHYLHEFTNFLKEVKNHPFVYPVLTVLVLVITLAVRIPSTGMELTESENITTRLERSEKTSETNNEVFFKQQLQEVYTKTGLQEKGLDFDVFSDAMVKYYDLKGKKVLSNKDVITIADMGKPSSEKRLYVIDLKKNKVLHHTHVSHGKNSGGNIADSFSNEVNSHKTSIGAYVTAKTYFGKHGLSLRLDGVDAGYNDNARERAIVMHGASYANPSVIDMQGRLGKSLGCPALPEKDYKKVINEIKGKNLLFIAYPDQNYRDSHVASLQESVIKSLSF